LSAKKLDNAPYLVLNIVHYPVLEYIVSTQKILADETVSISELRKRPQEYFTDHAIAVLSNNRTAGYIIGAEAYETLLMILRQSQKSETFEGRFRPTAERLREITEKGVKLLENANEEQLGSFSE
jgi:antitoxin YafN